MTSTEIIVIDASSVIKLKLYYPRDIFPGLWNNLDSLINSSNLVIPQEAFNEIGHVDNTVHRWLSANQNVIINPTKFQVEKVQEILRTYPGLLQNRQNEGDPFVIAVALELKNGSTTHTLVVTEEVEQYGMDKIPTACKAYNVPCYSLFDFIRHKKWIFN